MKYKFDRQDGIKDCGACTLHNIIKYYKGNISFEKLRNILNTDNNGTSVYDIVKVSNKLGLEAHAYNSDYDNLLSIKKPIIIHLNVEEKYSHFVILKNIKNDNIYLFDPIRGNIVYKKDIFLKEWDSILIAFTKTKNIVNEKSDYKFYIKEELKKNRKTIFIITFLSIITTFISSINSLYIKDIIDNINNNTQIMIVFMFLTILYVILYYVKNNIIINFNSNFDFRLTKNIYNHIISLPIKYHHNRPAGDVVSRVYDLYYIKDFINQLSFSIIVDVLLVIVLNIFMFSINKILFFISLIIYFFYIGIYFLFRKKINDLILLNQEYKAKENEKLVENLLGIDTIKNLNLEDEFRQRQYDIFNKNINISKKLNKIYNVFQTFQEFISLVSIIIFIFIGSVFIKNNTISMGMLVAYNTLLLNLFSCFSKIINYDNLIINSKNAYKRINELFSIDKEHNYINKKEFSNQIKINGLSYKYKNKKILKNLNFEINKNDCILISGRSGVGKSTVFKLITRQLYCDPKMILLDNNPLNCFSNNYIKQKICYVSQNEFIFTDSIKNNITLYKNSSKNDFNKALKISMVDKILKDRNININYLLEENGHNLSGGERQKIIIARTLLSNKKIIIFDETMNEIDIDSERKIIQNIKKEYNKTLVFISHRLSNKDLFNKCIEL